jgi:hypothetical protein
VPLLEVKCDSLKTCTSAKEKGQTPWSHLSESILQAIDFGPLTISSKQECKAQQSKFLVMKILEVPPRGQLSLTERNENSRGGENFHSAFMSHVICYL